MGYIDHALQPGEVVRHEARISWALYIGFIVGAAVGAGLLLASLIVWNQDIVNTGLVIGLGSVGGLIYTWFMRYTTEVAVTDRRIIYKTGLLNRSTIEMNLDKVESVDVRQSLLGRALDYGDVIVRGTGQGFEPIRGVDAPLALRNSITLPEHQQP